MAFHLSTSRLILREWRDADLAPFAQLNADPEVMEHFPKTLSRQESDGFAAAIKARMARHGFGLWAVERQDTGDFIGYVGFNQPSFQADFEPCVEIGWRLARTHWGQGFASEAAQACLDWGATRFKTLPIVSFTIPANRRSQRVMETIGLRYERDFIHPNLRLDPRMGPHVLYRWPG